MDLYRHAYALTYGDDRNAYIDAFLTLLNWETASRRYEAVFAREVPWPRPEQADRQKNTPLRKAFRRGVSYI